VEVAEVLPGAFADLVVEPGEAESFSDAYLASPLDELPRA
jgi:hypothetical protein